MIGAENAIPAPTPPKCQDDRDARPATASRSRIRADEKISVTAPAMPAMKRTTSWAAKSAVSPMTTSPTAFTASAIIR